MERQTSLGHGGGCLSHGHAEMPPPTLQAEKEPGAMQATALKMVYAGSGCWQPFQSWEGACPYPKEYGHILSGKVVKTQSIPWITHTNASISVSKVSSTQTGQRSHLRLSMKPEPFCVSS